MIAPFLRRELGARLFGDEIAEGGLPALEGAIFRGPVRDAFIGLVGCQWENEEVLWK